MAHTIPRQLPDHSSKKRKLSHEGPDDSDNPIVYLVPAVKVISAVRQIRRLHTLIEHELGLLQKIRYKQKNQHRAATWWRHLGGSQRVAKRFWDECDKYILPHLPDIQSSQPSRYLLAFRTASERS